MKDEEPLRVPDPSATIPDFGPRPDLSNAPNLAALMGGPSPMADSNRDAAKKKPVRPQTRDVPPPPVSRAAKEAKKPVVAEKSGPSMTTLIAVSLGLAVVAGAAAFALTLVLGLGAVFFFG